MRAKIWWQPTIRSGSLTRRPSFERSLPIQPARAARAPSGTNADDLLTERRPSRKVLPSQVWSHTEVTAANAGPSLFVGQGCRRLGLRPICMARNSERSFVAGTSAGVAMILDGPTNEEGACAAETRPSADHRRQSAGARGA